MNDLDRLRTIYKLKSVYRTGKVDSRKESSAEHTWSCLILADYFLGKIRTPIDRTKVYELLMYHDLVEIESGDVDFLQQNHQKKEIEMKAAHRLKTRIPSELSDKFIRLFTEFEDYQTLEAKFAQAIDKLDPFVHLLDYKEEWHRIGLTENIVREKKQRYMEPFPEILAFFEELIVYCRKHGYFSSRR